MTNVGLSAGSGHHFAGARGAHVQSAAMSDIVQYEVQGRVGVIRLNRPEARNAVNGDVAQAMEAVIDRFEDDDEVWVGIITANTEGQDRPVFCAGADLKAINSGAGGALGTRKGGFGGFASATARSR